MWMASVSPGSAPSTWKGPVCGFTSLMSRTSEGRSVVRCSRPEKASSVQSFSAVPGRIRWVGATPPKVQAYWWGEGRNSTTSTGVIVSGSAAGRKPSSVPSSCWPDPDLLRRTADRHGTVAGMAQTAQRMVVMIAAGAALVLTSAGACGPNPPPAPSIGTEQPTSAGSPDDTGTGDSGSDSEDANPDDAGTDDAGTDDAGPDDTGTDDAGPDDDEGPDDAG